MKPFKRSRCTQDIFMNANNWKLFLPKYLRQIYLNPFDFFWIRYSTTYLCYPRYVYEHFPKPNPQSPSFHAGEFYGVEEQFSNSLWTTCKGCSWFCLLYLYPRGRRYTPRSGGLPHTTNVYNGLMSTPITIYKLRTDTFMLMISTPDYPQVSGEERQINI